MTHLGVLIVATVTWFVWMPAASLARLASDGRGNVSILPIIPGAPLAAWGLTYVFPGLGIALIGFAHLVLLALMLISIARSRHALKSRGLGRRGRRMHREPSPHAGQRPL